MNLLNHPSLEFSAPGNRVLLMWDQKDSTDATVNLEISEEGGPVTRWAGRPRFVGKHTVLTPGSATCQEFQEWRGLRVTRRSEVCWHTPEGPFSYLSGEVTSYAVWR